MTDRSALIGEVDYDWHDVKTAVNRQAHERWAPTRLYSDPVGQVWGDRLPMVIEKLLVHSRVHGDGLSSRAKSDMVLIVRAYLQLERDGYIGRKDS